MTKTFESKCKTCTVKCSEFYDKDTTVYDCDDYIKETKKRKKRD